MTLPIETLVAFGLAHLLAAMVPGPNFFLVSNFAIGDTRRDALLAAMGIVLSVAVWSTAAAAGLNAVLERAPLLYEALRLVGAVYLIYIGARMIRDALRPRAAEVRAVDARRGAVLALRRGFVVNITNPKTVAYYTSAFAVLVPTTASPSAMLEIVSVALCISALWWIAVALAFSTRAAAQAFGAVRRPIEAIAGAGFVWFGLRIAVGRT